MQQPWNTYSVQAEGVWCGAKKRLSNPSESAQLLDCGDPCAEMVAVLNAIISPKFKALLIPVISLHFLNLSFSCMIDCGSSQCFINSHFAKVNYFPIVSIPQIKLCLIDRSLLSFVMHTTDISVQFPCGTTHQVRFLITKLDTKFPAVFKLDWLTLHNLLINWADSSVTFQGHPNILPVITSDSVLANHGELSLDDETFLNLSEDLPDPNPGYVPEPTPKFLLNPTIDSEPIHDLPETSPTSELTNSGPTQETYPTPFISLVSAEAFMRSMQSEGAGCFSILTHEPIDSTTLDKPKFNPDLEGVPEIYHKFADVFLK